MSDAVGILVVDDEPDIADLLKEVLDQTGHFVYTLKSLSREGLEPFFKSVKIDVVVTDFRLPGFDGHDVLKTARAYHPDCKVFLVSAFEDVPEQESFDRAFNKLDLSTDSFQPLLDAIQPATAPKNDVPVTE